MQKEFIDDAKLDVISDEELDAITGGAAAVYYSKPYVNQWGKEVVQVVSVKSSGDFNAGSGTFSSFSSSMTIASDKLGAYIERQQGRGYEVIGLDVAGPIV